MTEREIKQLLKLLDKLKKCKNKKGEDAFNSECTSILSAIHQWVRWYGHDEMDMDI